MFARLLALGQAWLEHGKPYDEAIVAPMECHHLHAPDFLLIIFVTLTWVYLAKGMQSNRRWVITLSTVVTRIISSLSAIRTPKSEFSIGTLRP